MNKLWYNSPKSILENMSEFFPYSDLSNERKINAIARFAIYFALLIIIFNEDYNWLLLSIILLIITLFLDFDENFTQKKETLSNETCQKPTKNNPFMNYTLGDLIDNPYRDNACNYEDVKKDIKDEFRSHVFSDSSDLWGKNITDRNFFTTPNTGLVNDQIGFGNWLLGSSGECKTTGKNCLKVRDPIFHRGRMIDNDINDNDIDNN